MAETDLISRQAAIDAFNGVKVDEGWCTEYDIGYNDGIDFAVSKLSVLPSAQSEVLACGEGELSAQPERTCVNCGRTINNGGWYADGRTRCPIEEHYALPKDGYCHLWEKRNITDDDYPERREK